MKAGTRSHRGPSRRGLVRMRFTLDGAHARAFTAAMAAETRSAANMASVLIAEALRARRAAKKP